MSAYVAPNVVYQAGADHDLPVAVSAPRYDEPLLPDYNGILTLSQDYEQSLPIEAASLNTTYPGDGVTPAQSDYYLVNESQRENAGAYKVRWTRTWARVPNTHTKPGGVFYYSFPGLASQPNRRLPTQPIGVACDILREFYLVGTGGSYASFDALVADKLQKAQTYYVNNPDNLLVSDEVILTSTTTPTEPEYQGWIADGTKILPRDSDIYRWMGNIFVVDTYKIRVQ